MTTDPMLEAIYKRAQEAERQRSIEQAEFDRAIRDGKLDINGVPIVRAIPRCGSVKDGTQCGYPKGHIGQHGNGPYLRWE